MDTKQKPDAWINNPKLAGMDMSKLAMLTQLAEQGKGKSPNELLPFLMSAASQNQKRSTVFLPGNRNHYSGFKSRKIPRRNPAYGSYASTHQNDALKPIFRFSVQNFSEYTPGAA